MEKQTVTIYDVAREAAVSMATVSRVVNGNPNVKPATRKKVLAVIERLDYRPNAVARGLASKRSTTVGVIIPDVTNIYFASLARGIDDIAMMYKYNIILTNSDDAGEQEVNVLNTLMAKQVDGVIFMGNHIDDKLRAEFKRAKAPVVLAGTVDPNDETPSVNIDYAAAVEEAVTNLIGRGHKKIALALGSLSQSINAEYRLTGYKRALTKAKIPFDDALVYEAYSYDAGRKLQPVIADSGATAVFVGDDEMAAGIINASMETGINVPDDLEVVTSNDTIITQITRPAITSITQPLYDIGAVAMRMLTKLMNDKELDEKTVTLPYGIVRRGSTKSAD
ncbi:catabolite control protein A [Lactiplantibacillus pentosus]|uniref:catabolite control protein A n=1 Tax=Lactiplantibacillus pentosus TaxID=1589 RepID=UPI001CD4A948|nr:catabolite control protein A [Lactiplantibacillus pentosus]MCA1342267.1 catabolite control protein A [Lactiplantibacillus pentosus]MCA1342344.1 catabolite control protein A [Lactiplantibacillus pentosus]MCJ8183230.1 catabolite control protein A [Lactiplantibacillus pentosus]